MTDYDKLNKSICIAKKTLEHITPLDGRVYTIIKGILDAVIQEKDKIKLMAGKTGNNLNKDIQNLEDCFRRANVLASGIRPFRAMGFCSVVAPDYFPIEEICQGIEIDKKEEIYFTYNQFKEELSCLN